MAVNIIRFHISSYYYLRDIFNIMKCLKYHQFFVINYDINAIRHEGLYINLKAGNINNDRDIMTISNSYFVFPLYYPSLYTDIKIYCYFNFFTSEFFCLKNDEFIGTFNMQM